MKLNSTRNLIVLAFIWLMTTGAGVYVTFVQQPEELERARRAEEVARLKQGEVGALLVEAAQSDQMAMEALSRWNARYKVIPDSISSPEVIGYLNDLTRVGFKNFDVTLDGITRRPDYSYYTYEASGRAFYASLYHFLWGLENNRALYRIRELTIDHEDVMTKDKKAVAERMEVMVSFSLKIDAYFDGLKGMSAEKSGAATPEGGVLLAAAQLPTVPSSVLPSMRPASNPFFPVVMKNLPPNTNGLIDVEKAVLVAIVAGKAVFQDANGFRRAGVGDEVYLGQITTVDPQRGSVVARLNKGGIADEIELNLDSGNPFTQARGDARLAPITNQ